MLFATSSPPPFAINLKHTNPNTYLVITSNFESSLTSLLNLSARAICFRIFYYKPVFPYFIKTVQTLKDLIFLPRGIYQSFRSVISFLNCKISGVKVNAFNKTFLSFRNRKEQSDDVNSHL